MKHLTESFLGVEEGITNAIKKLGLHAMGIDEEAVRHEALDELAMALQCLKTGEDEVRAVLQEADITTSDAQAKTAAEKQPGASPVSARDKLAEKLCDEPIVVDSDNLRRLQDAIGEISMQFTYVRERWGCDDCMNQIAEALTASTGMIHYMLGKCFMPDPKDDQDVDTSDNESGAAQ